MMHKIEHEGMWAEIRTNNALTEDQFERYKLRCAPIVPLIVDEYGVADDIVDMRLTQYARMSSRVANIFGVTYELAGPYDFASVIKQKFEVYIAALDDPKQLGFVNLILNYIYGIVDAPADREIAPGVTYEDDPKDKPPESGNNETLSSISSTVNAPNDAETTLNPD